METQGLQGILDPKGSQAHRVPWVSKDPRAHLETLVHWDPQGPQEWMEFLVVLVSEVFRVL